MDDKFTGVVSSLAETDAGRWFYTEQVHDWLYLIRELNFFEGNRCNIWLIKGSTQDVIIDTGLGVCDLNQYLTHRGLIHKNNRPCTVVCTHCHFDHCGGAQHFVASDPIYLHPADADAMRTGRQTSTLNYVKPGHFMQEPYSGFSACQYRVQPTPCQVLTTGQIFEIYERLEILHVPGHTKGNIAIYHPTRNALFSGDFVYECGHGSALIDWLPTSDVQDYVSSAGMMVDWFSDHPGVTVYPGHFAWLTAARAGELLQQYVVSNEDACGRCGTYCMQRTMAAFFCCSCFRCCPC